MNVRKLLDLRLTKALSSLGADDATAVVAPASRPEFGDYQANGAMAAAKKLKTNPRELAAALIEAAELDDIVATADVAGPGFINLKLSPDFLRRQLADPTLIHRVDEPQTIVVDYSAPNLAKELHVGHLRTTVIGDAMARTLEALGHVIYRQNHVGDWGTPFGKLIVYLDEQGESSEELADLERFYVEASEKFENDPAFADAARQFVVEMHNGKPQAIEKWRRFLAISAAHMQAVYDRMGISLKPEHTRGESAYNDDLASVVADLDAAGLLTLSDGAKCVFLDEFKEKGKDGNPLPMLVQKSDGGYLYHTTDLAAVRYRNGKLHADRALYFTDARQIQHFQLLFAVARAAGFAPPQMRLEHHPFGKMLDKTGKPFSTRDGSAIPIITLLDEAIVRARKVVAEKSKDLDSDELEHVTQAVAIGAIKYADLSKNRTNDYTFDWDTMLSFDGNTAPYLQYAYARIQSLFMRGQIDPASCTGEISIVEDAEHQLAVQLVRFSETLDQVASEVMPHYLCGFIYDLTVRFMRFYENCPVLDAPEEIRASRLALCAKTAATLQRGLGLLGIDTVPRM